MKYLLVLGGAGLCGIATIIEIASKSAIQEQVAASIWNGGLLLIVGGLILAKLDEGITRLNGKFSINATVRPAEPVTHEKYEQVAGRSRRSVN